VIIGTLPPSTTGNRAVGTHHGRYNLPTFLRWQDPLTISFHPLSQWLSARGDLGGV